MLLLAAQILRTSMASISFIASTTINIMIIRAENGLRTPFSRIIFGLSIVADIMKTLGIIISPLAAPRGTLNAPKAMGSTESCEGVGFVLYTAGQVAASFYIIFLTHYFLQRVN
jgi:Kef-type K+ transport system membrane component KefB